MYARQVKALSPMAVRARLSVHRSSQEHSTPRCIDAIVRRRWRSRAASTLDGDLKGKLKTGADSAAAAAGTASWLLSARFAGRWRQVTWCSDRGAFIYHGRVKALAEEAAREGGLSF
ncbi:50S ribosomal protein L18 [Brucella abortus]|nr:50S ribosomal protein L18 [Brucella abortus]